VVSAYGPQNGTEKVTFIASLKELLADLDTHFIMTGDLNGVVDRSHLAHPRDLRPDERDLAAMLGVGTDDDSSDGVVGRRLDVRPQDEDCAFTHRDPRGSHATIDHVVVGGAGSEAWQPLHACFPRVVTPTFVGRPFDHTFIVVEHNPPVVLALGPARPLKVNINTLPESVRDDLRHAIDGIPVDATASEADALQTLGEGMAKLIRAACEDRQDVPSRAAELHAPAKAQVQYHQGVLRSIEKRWNQASFFTPGRSPLLEHGALRRNSHNGAQARAGEKFARHAETTPTAASSSTRLSRTRRRAE
jgi:hypothetical protein